MRRPHLSTYEGELRSTIASTVGGVLTAEVGAVTGYLELSTRPQAGGVEVEVRYAGADEWYTIEGSPIDPGNVGGALELRDLHERIFEHLTTSGSTVDGNEEPVSLLGFSPTASNG